MPRPGLLSRLGNVAKLLGLKKKPTDTPRTPGVVGHRGVAAGNLKRPNLSQANVDQWRNLPPSEVEAFINDAFPLFVHSTNVSMLQYFKEERKLMVEYKKGGVYLYSNISTQEALDFARAPSKGGEVWDVLRIRGSKTAHRKPFVKIR